MQTEPGAVNVSQTQSQSQLLSDGNHISNSDKAAQDERKKKLVKYGIVGGVVVVAIVLIVVLSVTLSGGDEPKPGPPPEPDVRDLPKPLFNRTDLYTYTLIGDQNHEQVQGAIFASDNALRDLPIATGKNNEVITKLNFRMYMTDFQVACLEMTDADKPRFSIPANVVNKPKLHEAMRLEMLGFQMYPSENNLEFGFHNLAKPDEWFVRTTKSSFMFMDKYMQMDFQLPSRRLFGLGERVREFNLNQGTWTMWARGADSPWDNGMGALQAYGVHPFILIQTMNKNEYIGMFFRNSNQQSPVIQWNENGPVFNNKTSTLSYITTGGQIEVYFFIKGTAQWVISQYQNLVGKPTLPPFWTLGYSQGSWAYNNEKIYREVVANYSKADIPLETMWIDIEYMDKYATFTVDEQKFPTLKQFANELHKNDQKIVLIIDAGISADDNSRGKKNVYYTYGEMTGAFIKSTKFANESIKLKVWPNETVFPDWFTTKGEARHIWKMGMHDLYRQVPYDGLWVDMNENTGFCDGECPIKPTFKELEDKYESVRFLEQLDHESLQQAAPVKTNRSWYLTWNNQNVSSTYHLPFIAVEKNPDFMTLSLNATHAGGFLEYDVHSLNGLLSEANTYSIWKDRDFPLVEQRPFILSRSTFSGAGQYTSHWLGDNWRRWEYMRYSIAGIMNMNMFGVPHTGADVCGFFGKRDDELCARWTQLAAFYPFARNHYNRTYGDQPTEQSEPYVLSPKWQKLAKDAIYQRFEYLRLQYTCLFEASQFGKTCFDPTFFHIMNEDDNSGEQYKNIEQNFILGNALLISPILEPNVTSYNSLFPKGVWVSMNNFNDIIKANFNNVSLSTETERAHVHLMEGTVIPWQPIRDYSIKRTSQLIKNRQLSLVLSRNAIGVAMGSVFIDDGNRARDLQDDVKNYEYYQLQHTSKTLNFIDAKETKKHLPSVETENVYLEKLIIVNAEDLKDTDFACFMDHFMNPTKLEVKYEAGDKTLNIWSTNGTLRFSNIRQINYGNSNTEPNVCQQPAWTWKIKGDQPINLEQKSVTFNIVNQQANYKQELVVNMNIRSNGIVNVNYNFANLAPTQRTPYIVKDVIMPDSSIKARKLSEYVRIAAPGANFFFTVQNADGTIYYDTNDHPIILQENLVIQGTTLKTQPVPNFSGIYGLGQRISSFFLENGVYTMWNRDQPEGYDNGKTQGKNMYGTHPYYQGRSGPNQHFGVFSLNAAAQDWYITQDQDKGSIWVKQIAVGGIIDLYIFSNKSAEYVTQMYHELIGKTIMPPLWSLGWHQCRWGYRNTSDLIAVRTNYMTYDIPLDVLWSDIDYMDTYRDFTYNKDRFKDLPYLINEQLHTNKQYFVPILDAGISYRPKSDVLKRNDYAAFNEGIEKDVFMKIKGETFVGRVWPNEATFVDFDHPNAYEYWSDQLAQWRNKIRFDGLWLDMNEIANFCVGPCLKSQMLEQPSWSKLGYLPGHRNLEQKSTGLDVRHFDGSLELDQHSLYAFKEVRATSDWLKAQELRPFIISRASFSGQHRYGGMWLGDNFSDLKFLEYSITGIMNMNMYGFTIAGSDICGFIWDTTPDLCLKWSVVGAFYPFARNHNNFFEKPQEPYVFAKNFDDRNVSYTTMIRTAYLARYHLAKYMYTNIYRINQHGGTYFKPMFYEFGEDSKTYLDIQNNIMLGSALKLSVLTNDLKTREYGFYFPQGTWCNIYNAADKCFTQTVGGPIVLGQRLDQFWVHLRSGSIVPIQDATTRETTRIMDLQDTPIELHILPQKDEGLNVYIAKGNYMNDDGETLKTIQTKELMNDYNFELATTHQIGPERPLKSIIIDFSMPQRTIIYRNKCYTINKSDYLNKLYVYNISGSGFFKGPMQATVNWVEGVPLVLKTPNIKYDEVTDRIVLDSIIDSNSLCMSTIVSIVIEAAPTL